MLVGLSFFASDLSSDIREVARAAEGAGFESLYVPEHTHIPVSRQTPYPAGGELPPEHARFLDPFLALTAAATVTSTLRLGTGVCLVPERDPIHLAKETATLDFLSGGRLIFGVGCGWNREELADHGVDFADRWEILRERTLAVRELWTKEVASFSSPHVTISPSWQWPKPVTRPHPPIHIGGGGPTAMRHAAEYGDGWMPVPDRAKGSMGERMAALGLLAEAAGRPTPEVTAYAVRPEAGVLAHYAELGVARCVLQLPATGNAVAVVHELAAMRQEA